MRKEDLIRFHTLLVQMRRSFEVSGEVGDEFDAYDRLGVTPVSLHRDRRAHQMALFLLGEALSSLAVKRHGADAALKHPLHFIHQPRRWDEAERL